MTEIPAPLDASVSYAERLDPTLPAVDRGMQAVAVPAAERRPGVRATLNSLTGYDEIAIKRAFGEPVAELDETMVIRSAYFVLRRRGGDSDAAALEQAMDITLGALKRAFSDTEDDETEETSGSTPEG